MNATTFEMNLDPNKTEFIRGKRAEIGMYDDWAGENIADMLVQIEPLKYPKDASRECLGFNPYIIADSTSLPSLDFITTDGVLDINKLNEAVKRYYEKIKDKLPDGCSNAMLQPIDLEEINND